MTNTLSAAPATPPGFSSSSNVTRIDQWQRPDPATLPPDRRAAALWARLAAGINYYGQFIEGALIQCPAEPCLDHAQVVQHRSGQYAFYGDGHNVTRAAVDAFAAEHGMTVDHFGDGLWEPGSTTAVVLRVTDPLVAAPFFGTPGAFGHAQRCFVVRAAHRFMPPRARKTRT